MVLKKNMWPALYITQVDGDNHYRKVTCDVNTSRPAMTCSLLPIKLMA